MGKPIVAGLNGYSAQFLKNHIPYASIFKPGDPLGAVSCIQSAPLSIDSEDVLTNFVKAFSRVSIMNQMANHLINTIE